MPYMKMRMILGCIGFLLSGAVALAGDTVYRSPESFVNAAFATEDGAAPPEASVLWLGKTLRRQVVDVLGRQPPMRIRYWQNGERSAWVLDEIGKDQPITAGFVVERGALESVDVLVFRESRGWEVKYPFFTRQFREARLDADNELDRSIDGITGATLSVRAMTRMARVALLLDQHIRAQGESLARVGASAAD